VGGRPEKRTPRYRAVHRKAPPSPVSDPLRRPGRAPGTLYQLTHREERGTQWMDHPETAAGGTHRGRPGGSPPMDDVAVASRRRER
jgi:hypothetical protein